jgi:hypothetical protein
MPLERPTLAGPMVEVNSDRAGLGAASLEQRCLEQLHCQRRARFENGCSGAVDWRKQSKLIT